MAKVEETFTWKALHEQDGLKVSESPWGPDDGSVPAPITRLTPVASSKRITLDRRPPSSV